MYIIERMYECRAAEPNTKQNIAPNREKQNKDFTLNSTPIQAYKSWSQVRKYLQKIKSNRNAQGIDKKSGECISKNINKSKNTRKPEILSNIGLIFKKNQANHKKCISIQGVSPMALELTSNLLSHPPGNPNKAHILQRVPTNPLITKDSQKIIYRQNYLPKSKVNSNNLQHSPFRTYSPGNIIVEQKSAFKFPSTPVQEINKMHQSEKVPRVKNSEEDKQYQLLSEYFEDQSEKKDIMESAFGTFGTVAQTERNVRNNDFHIKRQENNYFESTYDFTEMRKNKGIIVKLPEVKLVSKEVLYEFDNINVKKRGTEPKKIADFDEYGEIGGNSGMVLINTGALNENKFTRTEDLPNKTDKTHEILSLTNSNSNSPKSHKLHKHTISLIQTKNIAPFSKYKTPKRNKVRKSTNQTPTPREEQNPLLTFRAHLELIRKRGTTSNSFSSGSGGNIKLDNTNTNNINMKNINMNNTKNNTNNNTKNNTNNNTNNNTKNTINTTTTTSLTTTNKNIITPIGNGLNIRAIQKQDNRDRNRNIKPGGVQLEVSESIQVPPQIKHTVTQKVFPQINLASSLQLQSKSSRFPVSRSLIVIVDHLLREAHGNPTDNLNIKEKIRELIEKDMAYGSGGGLQINGRNARKDGLGRVGTANDWTTKLLRNGGWRRVKQKESGV